MKRVDFSKAQLLVFVLIFAGVGGYVIWHSLAATSTTVANVFVAPNGSDTGVNCVRFATAQANPDPSGATLCASFNKAYQLASGGDTAVALAGSYGAQNLSYKSTVGDFVTFKPSGTVTFTGRFCIGNTSSTRCDGVNRDPASWVKMQGDFLYQGGISVYYRNRVASHITFDGGHTSGGSFGSTDTLVLKNLEVGPTCCSSDGIDVNEGNNTEPYPSNTTLDNVYIHDIARRCAAYPGQSPDGFGPAVCPGDDASAHVDCIQFFSNLNGVTIKNSRFFNCGTQGIFFGGTGQGSTTQPTDCAPNLAGCYSGQIVLENDMVGPVYEPGNEIIIGRDDSNDPSWAPGTSLTIRNVSTGSLHLGTSTGSNLTSVTETNNIQSFQSWVSCTQVPGATFTYSHNIFSGKTCGATDILDANYQDNYTNWDKLAPDLHLKPGAEAIDAGDPAICPATDFDGDTRPQGVACDIGADEYMSTYYVDQDSVGGACNDSYSLAQAQSKATPWCTVTKALQSAPDNSTVYLRAAQYPEAVLNNFRNSSTNYLTIEPYPAEANQVSIAGAYLRGFSYVRFQGLSFTAGIEITDTSQSSLQHVQFVDNDITGRHGIFVNGDSVVIDPPHVADDILVQGNHIHDIHYPEFDQVYPADGYCLKIAADSNLTIKDNIIEKCDADAIQGGGDNLTITGNEIRFLDIGIHTTEHQDIWQVFSGGNSNMTFSNNYIHDNKASAEGIIIQYAAGTTYTEYQNITLENNIISGLAGFGWEIMDTSGLTIRNNTVWDTGLGVSFIDSPEIAGTTANAVVVNNIFPQATPGNGSAYSGLPTGYGTEDYNIAPSPQLNGTYGVHDILNQSPAFIDTAASNFHLTASSLATNAGDPTSCPVADYEGDSRPQGSACDIGADEYVLGATSSIQGDLNADDHVNVLDLSMLLSHWQSTATPMADINTDGKVDILDLSILLSHYGT